MTVADSLLPGNATAFETALSLTTDTIPRVDAAIALIVGAKYRLPRDADLMPFLIAEYGLGELTPYVPALSDIIDEGIDWQRIRGTPDAIDLGLSWLTYTAFLEEAPVRRRRWHLFQLGLDRVRDNEEPDLNRIEGIATLSAAARSHFFRGYSGYDVRALETSYKKTSGSMLGTDSGARIRAGGALWSFGRPHERDYSPSQAELTGVGIWIAPSTDPFAWNDMWFSWDMADFAWDTPVNTVRRRIMAAGLVAKTCWIEFKNAGGAVIGYRRARANHQVALDNTNGNYVLGANKYLLTPATDIVFVEALTDFSDGYGATSASHSLIFDAVPVDPTKPGLLWAAPGELQVPGFDIATYPRLGAKTETILFGRTVRERVATLLRITA